MCKHCFDFPEDRPENYNPDGLTLTGQCKCGATQQAYGMRWLIPKHDDYIDSLDSLFNNLTNEEECGSMRIE